MNTPRPGLVDRSMSYFSTTAPERRLVRRNTERANTTGEIGGPITAGAIGHIPSNFISRVQSAPENLNPEDEKAGEHNALAGVPTDQRNFSFAVEHDHAYIAGGKHMAALKEEGLPASHPLQIVDFDLPLTLAHKTKFKGNEYIILNFVEDDPEDPFNWSTGRKYYITALLCLMTLTIGLATTAYSSGINSMVRDLDTSTEIGQLGLFLFNIACALAPLFLAPFCELVGRRVVYVGSYVCFTLIFIGLALGRNIATILVMRLLLGLFGCVGTILVGGTFGDMFREHERAVPMAWFSYVAIFGTVGAPIYAGFIDQTIGWRWIEGIQGLANVPLLLALVFTLKETRGGVALSKRAKMLRNSTGDERYEAESDLAALSIKDMLHESSVKAIHMLVTEPVVLAFGMWIGFAWFVTFLFLSVIPITFSDKRGWSEGVSGLPYISLCIGVTLAFALNFINIRYYKGLVSQSKNGKVVPEKRLYGAMYGALWLPIGLFLYAFTQYGYLPWIAPVISLAPIAFGIFYIFESTYSFTSDCYGLSAGSAIAGQGLVRNTLGAVSPLFATQFFRGLGSQYAGLLLALVAVFLTFIPYVFYRIGHKLRARSKLAETFD